MYGAENLIPSQFHINTCQVCVHRILGLLWWVQSHQRWGAVIELQECHRIQNVIAAGVVCGSCTDQDNPERTQRPLLNLAPCRIAEASIRAISKTHQPSRLERKRLRCWDEMLHWKQQSVCALGCFHSIFQLKPHKAAAKRALQRKLRLLHHHEPWLCWSIWVAWQLEGLCAKFHYVTRHAAYISWFHRLYSGQWPWSYLTCWWFVWSLALGQVAQILSCCKQKAAISAPVLPRWEHAHVRGLQHGKGCFTLQAMIVWYIHLMSTLCAGLGQKDDGPVCSVTGSAFEAVPLCLLMAQWTSLYVGFDLGCFGFCKSTVYSYSLELLCNFIAVPTISHYLFVWCMTVSLKKGPGRKQLASAVRSIIDAGQRPRMQGRYAMLKCWVLSLLSSTDFRKLGISSMY